MYVFHVHKVEIFQDAIQRHLYTAIPSCRSTPQCVVEAGGQTDLGPAFHIVLHWLASDLPGNPSASNSHLTVRTLADRHDHLWFYYSGAGYLNSGPQAGTVTAPPTGSSP